MNDRQSDHRPFISHSSADKAFVNRLIKRLDEHGVARPWYDTFDLPHGTEDIPASISEAIGKASAFVLVLSPKSADSHWVNLEIGLAEQRGIPILVLLHDVEHGGALLARGHPQIANVLNGGRRKVIDFTIDFESAFIDFLEVIEPATGFEPRIDQVFRAILDDDDPDSAERQMTLAALHPEPYLKRILPLLPELREDVRLNYRAGKALAYIGSDAIRPLMRFLLLIDTPESDGLAGPAVEPTDVDPESGTMFYTGSAFSDFMRALIISGGNRAWAAQVGASAALVAIAVHDPRLRGRIERMLGEYLTIVANGIPAIRDDEIGSDVWDPLQMALWTIRDIGPTNDTDSWLIKEFASGAFWGDSALEAARRIGGSVVECLSRIGNAKACDRLLDIARSEPAMRAIWFEDAHGTMAHNPWESCFVPFGNHAVDGLLGALRDGDTAFARLVRLNLANLPNHRAHRAVIAYLEGDQWVDDLLHAVYLVRGMGGAREPQSSTRLLDLYLSGRLDPLVESDIWHDDIDGLAAAVATATDDRLAARAAKRLSASTSPLVRSKLSRSIGERKLVKYYATVDEWRTAADMPFVRGWAAVSLARGGFFRNSAQLQAQLDSANPDVERPLLGIALAELGDPRAIELLSDGLRSTFVASNGEYHEVYAEALTSIGTPEARAARAKWYRRI